MTLPVPRTPAPALEVETVGGTPWRLAESAAKPFTLIVFYRGLHCPICKPYLRDLDRRIDDFTGRGVAVIAISGDSAQRAAESVEDWGLEKLAVGYGQSIASMREWGLFVSRAIRDGEPDEFGEPGLFLIKPDGTVYCASVASMPFARPNFGDLMQAIDFIVEKDYPARGEA